MNEVRALFPHYDSFPLIGTCTEEVFWRMDLNLTEKHLSKLILILFIYIIPLPKMQCWWEDKKTCTCESICISYTYIRIIKHQLDYIFPIRSAKGLAFEQQAFPQDLKYAWICQWRFLWRGCLQGCQQCVLKVSATFMIGPDQLTGCTEVSVRHS